MSKIIAHRGGRGIAPENSTAAFIAAAQMGARWAEMDARLIRDGSVILFHDDRLKWTIGRKGKVSNLVAQAARKLGISFLADVLESDLGLGLNIELKLDRGADDQQAEALADAVADLIQTTETSPQILVSSLSKRALLRFKERLPSIPLGVVTRPLTDDVLAFASSIEAASIHTRLKETTPQTVEKIIQAGFESYVWTIKDPRQAQPLWQAGMTGLFTYDLEKFL